MNAARFLLAAALLSAPATASQPVGQDFGPWHVVSIPSLSGTSGDDAMAALRQEADGAELAVRWVQGERVKISLRIKHCTGEGDDFERSDSVDPGEALRQPVPEVAIRLRADFTDWLKEARLSCRSGANGSALQLDKLDPAVAGFLARLRYLAPELAARSR